MHEHTREQRKEWEFASSWVSVRGRATICAAHARRLCAVWRSPLQQPRPQLAEATVAEQKH